MPDQCYCFRWAGTLGGGGALAPSKWAGSEKVALVKVLLASSMSHLKSLGSLSQHDNLTQT